MAAPSPVIMTAFAGLSQPVIKSTLAAAYRHRHDLSLVKLDAMLAELSGNVDIANAIVRAACDIVLSVLYVSDRVESVADVVAVLGDSPAVKTIAPALLELLPLWRRAATESRVSLPRLVDVDWRIDVKTATDAVSHMSVPSLLVSMKVAQLPTNTGYMPTTGVVNFEMSKEALGAMLAGLHKIRDQLEST